MKYATHILFITVLMFCTIVIGYNAVAEECKDAVATETLEISKATPAYFEDKHLAVIDANGMVVAVFPAKTHKIVPRMYQKIVTKETRSCVWHTAEDRSLFRPNRVTLLGGQGPTGHLKTTRSGGDAEVEAQRDLILGAGYQRMLNNRWSLGVQYQDVPALKGSGTGLGSLSYDY